MPVFRDGWPDWELRFVIIGGVVKADLIKRMGRAAMKT